jgi:hypothetical protein
MPIRRVAGFEKFGPSGRAIPAHPEPMRARRGIAARYIKANSSRKGSRPVFPAAWFFTTFFLVGGLSLYVV